VSQVSRSGHNVRFIIICLALFLGGGFLRSQSGGLTLPRPVETLTPPAAGEPLEQQEQLPPGLRETVSNFYEWIDRGYYKEAHQISLENKWLERGPDTYVRGGLTSQDEFVNALNQEWRVNGTDLNVVTLDVLRADRLLPERRTPSERPELYTLNDLPPGIQAEDIYEVTVAGLVIERCSTWEWDKKLLVAKLGGTGGWKILLPGIPDARFLRAEVWFLDKNPFAELHIVQE